MTRTQHSRLKRLEGLQRRVQDRFSITFLDIGGRLGAPAGAYALTNMVVRTTRRTIDNPNQAERATTPVLQVIEVHMPLDVDVRNGDTLTVKHVNSKGEITDAFRGVAGASYTNDGRKHVMFAYQALGREDIRDTVIPAPPPVSAEEGNGDLSEITIEFVDLKNNQIHDPIIRKIRVGEMLTVEALPVHGFEYKYMYLEGVQHPQSHVTFKATQQAYSVVFIYDAIDTPLYIKQFAVGRFRRDDGSFDNGTHWYQSIPIKWVGDFELVIPVKHLVHLETRQTLHITKGSRLLLIPNECFAEVLDIMGFDDGFKITLMKVEPTQEELSAFITNSYGVWGG